MANQISLMSIAGARPNFMKLAAISRAIAKHNTTAPTTKIRHIIVHTGQHYDAKLSSSFFRDLNIPEPDINLEVGSGSHAQQTAEIMKRFEPVLLKEQPDALLVVGDVNSTIACALVAAKIEYPPENTRKRPRIIHVEAGLRSFDRNMPEEINRILTDSLSDLLFVTEESGLTHLASEGVHRSKIHFVGNVMIDTLQQHLERAEGSNVREKLGIRGGYGLITLHRPSNVDSSVGLSALLESLIQISKRLPLVFPVHPRTRSKITEFGLEERLAATPGIQLTEPLGYLDFLNLTSNATLVLTDSGGIQEETTYLGIPCITLRENTERPVTVTVGSNYLIGTDPEKISATVAQILEGKGKPCQRPTLWDGQAGERIVEIIARDLA